MFVCKGCVCVFVCVFFIFFIRHDRRAYVFLIKTCFCLSAKKETKPEVIFHLFQLFPPFSFKYLYT